ncbi:hypothetical protein PIB30_031606 [Stylosanthes scabra]|uniref:Uncharacterized protein n=1 Tax=Stylosanthes scabra TaxID=79078 RepID=A0ABU6TBM0_9FABA|nr:hypothetical protein [Stylosanthes scabra]
MEKESLLPKPTYGGIKRYMRRRRYHRLDENGGTKTTKTVWLTGPPRQRRRWKVRAIRRLTWVAIRSPLKMWTKLKNAYMNFMLTSMNIDNPFGEKKIPKAHGLPKSYSRQEFEARLIFEISKALVASNELYTK